MSDMKQPDMNNAEAAAELKNVMLGIIWCSPKTSEAFRVALTALAEPVSETLPKAEVDENGHALCGCGGKARLHVWQSNGGNISVTCSTCTIQITGVGDGSEVTEQSIQNMWDLWNRAMGLRPERE